jgi:hypothetical protein
MAAKRDPSLPYLQGSEACRRLGRAPAVLYRLAARGDIKVILENGVPLYCAADVARFVRQWRKEGPRPCATA